MIDLSGHSKFLLKYLQWRCVGNRVSSMLAVWISNRVCGTFSLHELMP